MKKGNRIIRNVVTVIMGIILFHLFMLSGVSTSVMREISEKTYIIKDNIWSNLLGLIILCFALICAYKWGKTRKLITRINENESLYRIILGLLLLLLAVIACAFVLLVHEEPYYDQADIYRCAGKLLVGDNSEFVLGGYMNKYPHQWGLVLLVTLFEMIFGLNNYIVFQIINVLGVVLIYLTLALILKESGRTNATSLGVVLSGFAFVVLLMYSVLCYGTIWGTAFSLLGYYLFLKLRNDNKWWYIPLSLLSFAMGIIIKKNSIIFFLGVLACFIVQKNKRKLQYIFIVFSLCAVWASSKLPEVIIKQITGIENETTVHTLNWVVMGLQEGHNANGWYNRYVSQAYKDNDYDMKKQKKADIELLKARLNDFTSDPAYAWDFFQKKNSSQWNNPSFQILWVMDAGRNSKASPKWICELLTYPQKSKLIGYMNFWHFAILFLALTNCIFMKEREDSDFFFFATFIGGFLFHTIWEAQALYTLPYFILLLPFAFEEIGNLVKNIVQYIESSDKKNVTSVKSMAVPAALIVAISVYAFLPTQYLKSLEEDTLAYTEYADLRTVQILETGKYLLEGNNYSKEVFVEFTGDKGYLLIDDINDEIELKEGNRLVVHKSQAQGYVNVLFWDAEEVSAVTYSSVNKRLELQNYRDSKKQQFKLTKIEP